MVFKTNYHLMQVKSIALCFNWSILTFIKLPFVIKIFLLAIYDWLQEIEPLFWAPNTNMLNLMGKKILLILH